MPSLHSGAAIDRPETTHVKLPPIPEVVWQQPQETHVSNIYLTVINENHENTHMPESKQRSDVESQTSPIKENSPQVSLSGTEPSSSSRPHPRQNNNTTNDDKNNYSIC